VSAVRLGRNVHHQNHLSGRDRARADLAARTLAAQLAADWAGALVVFTPRLFSGQPDDGCDLCGMYGPAFDQVWWSEWETRRDHTSHAWSVHRRCLIPTIQRASDGIVSAPEVVLALFGLRRDVVPAAFYTPRKVAA
jgi:hypothetical protein